MGPFATSGVCSGAQRTIPQEGIMGIESLIVLLIVGAIAGWLAGVIVKGYGFGLIGNIAVGIVGAFLGNFILGAIGLTIGGGIIAAIIRATIGAVILLFVIGLIRR
jgi:uncharacterized membrane protein YeaQ/YmgE (transglycosylase-associated protein family)